MTKIVSNYGIYANLIKDSVSSKTGQRMMTFEIYFHRWILAELNTHRALSKNLQSSRAIPLKSAIEYLQSGENMAYPVHWGKNQPGMQSKEELVGQSLEDAIFEWDAIAQLVFASASKFESLQAHKQWASRILEPFTMTKGILSGTDWDNMLWLRNDVDAQPEFRVLAECIQKCADQSTPIELQPGEWHLPYIESARVGNRGMVYYDASGDELTLDDGKKISASCCAQVSYRKLDDSKNKALEIYSKLFSGRKPHMSPTEHMATPITPVLSNPANPDTWEEGVTHMDRSRTFHSGNLTNWIQYRQTLPNNVYKESK